MLKRTRLVLTLACASACAAALAVGCGGGEAPAPPTLDATPAMTNQSPYALTGSGEAGATVQVRGGAEAVVEAQVGGDGAFEVPVPLRADVENILLVSQISGGLESEATVVTLTHDGIAPDTPRVDPATTPTRLLETTLRGSAEANASIVVTGGLEERSAEVDASGRFEITVALLTNVAALTENVLEIVAIDPAGNASEPAIQTIIHNPALPLEAPTLDDLPSFTSDSRLTISGSSEAGAALTITGGAEAASATVGADGRFSTSLSLRANAENHLSVFAVVTATGVGSAPALRTITHDDIAPEAPELDSTTSVTGATVVRISGRSEPLAQLTITGGAEAASGAADEDGRFGLDLALTLDSLNELAVVATDRAGNAGAEASLAIEQDSSLEAPVSVDPLPSPTSLNPVTITGRTEASADLEITGGVSTVSGAAGADGSFSLEVSLRRNERNELRVHRLGGSVETILVLDHDDIAPRTPSIDALPSPTNRTDIRVSGSSEPGARISISGGLAPAAGNADTAGRFSIPVSIAEDVETALTILATDRAGNSSSPSLTSITHSSEVPDAPILDDPSPAPSPAPTHMITGHLSMPGAGISVVVRGGVSEAMATTDESTGAFAVEVTLHANADNTLSVRSLEGAVESPEALVTITHDDIAPTDPDGARISLGSPSFSTCIVRAERINVTGSAMAAEAFSRARVENFSAGGTSVSADVAVDGSFATNIAACRGDVLRIRAIDAAGNSSAATEMTVM